jgi:dihydroorotate dehydrogenase
VLYSVIFKSLTGDDLQTIGKRINPPVLAKIGARLDAQETREAINSLTAINNEALVIDLDAVTS